MRVIVAHNFYQQPGGEDQVFADEVRLLRERGHDVEVFTAHNEALKTKGRLAQLRDSIWNGATAEALGSLVSQMSAEVVHFHNTFPLISPAAYYAAHRGGAAVVQTLHNYRLICAGALLYRDGGVCESCVGQRAPLGAVRNACYRGSRVASAATSLMTGLHRLAGTWRREVDLFLPLTNFGREKFIAAGLPPERLRVKPNFLQSDPGPGEGAGGYALFVGRLTDDKGVGTLLDAWRLVRDIPLKVVGDGPLMDRAREMATTLPNVEILGRRPSEEVLELISGATCLVFPSRWYEGQPKTIIESLACGTPVIASRLGAMQEMLEASDPSLLFTAGNPFELAKAVEAFWARGDHRELRHHARSTFEREYTADRNYRELTNAYRTARATYRTNAAGVPAPEAWEHQNEHEIAQNSLARTANVLNDDPAESLSQLRT
jgi:glycosyltransferase involved in cell wall biosynthesis